MYGFCFTFVEYSSIDCEQVFGRVGNWGDGKAKWPVDKHLGPHSTAHAVHQILMQAPIGENTDC